MLLSHCPNCQHDNKLGERFCASCGVPLDLKPCSVCGKVDSVKATVCSGCGAHFPPLTGLSYVDEPAGAGAAAVHPTTPVVSQPPSTMRALPLIVVALAAAGIPLLWLYRNQMPLPKAWQPSSTTVETSTAHETVVPTPPRASAIAAPQPAATPDATVPALIPLPLKTAPTDSDETQSPIAGPATDAPKPAPVKPAVKPIPKPVVKTTPKPAVPTAAPGDTTCTEALAAVGLCERKAVP
jgi:hypothetical protein